MQNLASIQKRTSPKKFAHLAEKSEKGSISNLSTKALTVSAATENVAGVQLPLLNLAVDRRTTPFPNLGVRAFEKFEKFE